MDDDSEPLDRLIAAEQDERRRIALFLHDGPVQNLSGIALMLDAALHSVETGKLDDATKVLSIGTRAAAQHDSRASRPFVRSRAGRPARSGIRACPRGARRAGRRDAPPALRPVDRRCRSARRDRTGRAVHDHSRAARPGGPPRAADQDRHSDHAHCRRRRRDGRRRQRRAGAAQAVARVGRAAPEAASRHDRRRLRRRRHLRPGHAAVVRDPALTSAAHGRRRLPPPLRLVSRGLHAARGMGRAAAGRA